jgi:hypothetical protein
MIDPEIFIVRIWRQLAGGFRASARRVDDEQAHFFTAADEVARFFERVEPRGSKGCEPEQIAVKEKP